MKRMAPQAPKNEKSGAAGAENFEKKNPQKTRIVVVFLKWMGPGPGPGPRCPYGLLLF